MEFVRVCCVCVCVCVLGVWCVYCVCCVGVGSGAVRVCGVCACVYWVCVVCGGCVVCRSEEQTSELQSRTKIECRALLGQKKYRAHAS